MPLRARCLRTMTSAGGARIRLQDAVRISNQGAGWTATPAGTVSFAGGGLPNGVLRLAAGRGGGFDGLLRMDDYAAGGAALALPWLAVGLVRGATKLRSILIRSRGRSRRWASEE